MNGSSERCLVDTNILLVSLVAPERLTSRTRVLLQREDLFVSVLSYWEVVIKTMKGHLNVGDVRQWWADSLKLLQAVPLPFHPDHTAEILSLPLLHKDPFDRALLAQAGFEQLILITADSFLLKYSSDRIRVIHAPILGDLIS